MKKIIKLIRKIVIGYKSDSVSYIRYLKFLGMEIGDNCYVWSPMQTLIDQTRPWAIKIGNNVNIATGVKILTHGYEWSVLKYKYGKVYGSYGKVEIGDNVLFGPRVGIYTSNHAIDANERVLGGCYAKKVKIGNNVWIGGGVQINQGVSIGDNTIIGSGSVVTKNIPANVIAAGIPCKVIRAITQDDKTGFNG